MDMVLNVLKDGVIGSLNTILGIAVIVIPLMIIMEFARELKILDKIGELFKPLAKIFNLSNKSIVPLTVGVIIGISYGSGVLIDSKEKGDLTLKDSIIVSIFLGACHAVFEDTLLFVAIGADGVIVLTTRVVVAFILALFASRIVREGEVGISSDK